MVMENTNTLIYLLKDRFSFIDEIHNSEKLNSKIVSLLFTSFSCFAIYGAIIGAQLGWTLRPFFGTGSSFELFRPREGSFFTAVWESFHRIGF
jgi:hypothetical protein